jgi:hypothetical protein
MLKRKEVNQLKMKSRCPRCTKVHEDEGTPYPFEGGTQYVMVFKCCGVKRTASKTVKAVAQMRMMIQIKQGINTLTELVGTIDIDPRVSELEKVVEVEQYLERLLGYRFHINEVVRLIRKEKDEIKNP